MKRPVFCGQDFAGLVGFTIMEVESDEFDMNVSVRLEKESESITLIIEDGVLVGESIFLED